MKKILVGTSLVLFALVAGCVSTGRDFDGAKAPLIKNGVTTKSQIQGWFGYPYMTGIDNGDEAWTYSYSKTVPSGQTLIKTLYIVFDDAGVVKSHTFSTSFPEEMSVSK